MSAKTAEPGVEQRVVLTDAPIDVGAVTASVQHAGAGGVSVFLGAVRDEADGRPVTLLEYEAYRPMAIAEMRRCVDEIEAAYHGVVRLSVTHRIGRLSISDLAVACAASAPHRAEAFSACRALIDAIKARVPIWKREHGPEGAYWVGWRDARCGDEHEPHHHEHHGHHEHHEPEAKK